MAGDSRPPADSVLFQATILQLNDLKEQQRRMLDLYDKLQDSKADHEAVNQLREDFRDGFDRLEQQIREQAKAQQSLATKSAITRDKLSAVTAVLLGAGAFLVALVQAAVTNKWFG